MTELRMADKFYAALKQVATELKGDELKGQQVARWVYILLAEQVKDSEVVVLSEYGETFVVPAATEGWPSGRLPSMSQVEETVLGVATLSLWMEYPKTVSKLLALTGFESCQETFNIVAHGALRRLSLEKAV